MVKIFKQRSDVTGHLTSEGYTSPLVSGGGTMASSTGGDSGHLFLMFGGASLHWANAISLLGKILTYKNLIYLTNFLNNKVCLEN